MIMLNFTSYLNENATTKYVSVIYNQDTQTKLRNWAKENGFDLSVDFDGKPQKPENFEFHTTIFYTTSKHDLKNQIVTIPPNIAVPSSIIMIGVDSDIPVLKVKSNAILNIRNQYKKTYGMKDAWPEYLPHISVSYSKTIPDLTKAKLPTFDLVFDKLRVEDAI